MDEATASLSAASDLEVQRVMKEVFQGCTVFNVAHWDSPLQVNDLELFIEKGKLENAWRLKSDEEDEEAAEEKLARDEDETAYLRRLLRKKIKSSLFGACQANANESARARAASSRIHRRSMNEPTPGSAGLESAYGYPANRCVVVHRHWRGGLGVA
ncbi:hypothetical protein MY4038_004063 [Beauveria bassiana]